ncbi:MAG: bactofilin family protein [Akkermansiaceae bacterium]
MFKKVIGQSPEPEASPSRPSNFEAPASTPPSSSSSPSSAASSAPRSSTPAPAPSGRNVLSADVEIKGHIKFSNDLVVDGRIEGEIESDGSLTIGENAHIKAEIKTRSVIIYGKVHGNIEVSDKVELKANAELVGNIKAASLSIEPGAIFVGKSTVGTPSIKPAAATATAAKPTASSTPSAPAGSK